jgi:tetraacyldisaccharide 4'-kinase
MSLKSPKFWNKSESYLGYILQPLSWLYQGGTTLHKTISKPYKAPVPVISIGNFVMGGAGKTPVTIALTQELQKMGWNPHIISRGYGGSLQGPVRVDPTHHQFRQVGDEPLLLAKVAPTWISKNRRAAVTLSIKAGADILLLDDAHQNYMLEKDISIIVVSSIQGFGNGRVFPAGPLRQSVQTGLKNTTIIIFIGQDTDPLPKELGNLNCPLVRATIVPLDPRPYHPPCAVVAFTGIGYPEKFRQTLVEAGYQIKGFSPFPDHYPFTHGDLNHLKTRARLAEAHLITTEKDAVRIPPISRANILTLPMGLNFHPQNALKDLLKQFLKI